MSVLRARAIESEWAGDFKGEIRGRGKKWRLLVSVGVGIGVHCYYYYWDGNEGNKGND